MRVSMVGVLGLLLFSGPALAREPVPVGEEFQVNTYTTSFQFYPSVAVNASGDFIVVWSSDGSDGTDTSYTSIQGQHYDAAGSPVGGQFQVNTYTTNDQLRTSVAPGFLGGFVVVWDSFGSPGSDTSSYSIQGQRYDAAGSPVGGQFQVNTYTTGYQAFPAVATGAQGSFVVVWDSLGSPGSDTSSYSIQGQRYDPAGSPLGSQFQVNTYTRSFQVSASVAFHADGNFVVVWGSNGSYGTDNSNTSVQGQRYDGAGTPIGGQFRVNTYTTSFQSYPSVALDADGDFVVVWESDGSNGTDTDSWSIQGQRYDASGAPVGGEFQVNTYTTSRQLAPRVAVDADGDFVVIWKSDGSFGTDSSLRSIQGQRYDASGAPVGGEFQVNTYTTGVQDQPAVAGDPQGSFVVVWESGGSFGTDTDFWSIQGQRFADLAIFSDGFESGDTSAWSHTVP